jgi:hypothetical protein
MLKLIDTTRFVNGKYGLKENWDYFLASDSLFPYLSSEKGGNVSCFLTTFVLEESALIEAITNEVVQRLKEQPTAEQQIYSLMAESEICPSEEPIVAQIAKMYCSYSDDFCRGDYGLLVYLRTDATVLPVIMRYKSIFGCTGDIATGYVPAGTRILLSRNQRIYPTE